MEYKENKNVKEKPGRYFAIDAFTFQFRNAIPLHFMTRYAKYKKKFNDSEFSGVSKPAFTPKRFQNSQNNQRFNGNSQQQSFSKKICLKCRSPGHTMSTCPQSKSTQVYCYNCGESDHNPKDCVLPFSNYAHALCFLCDTKGHLASACPKNERGVYPNGGCCHFCGSVKHLARNCKPAQSAKNGNEVLVSASADPNANPEDDDVHEALKKIQTEREQKKEQKSAEKKKKKVVTF